MGKSLENTDTNGTKQNVPDVVFWGRERAVFKLITKASSKKESWMKSTKALQVGDQGCLVQVTTQQGDNVAEALTFVPDVAIHEEFIEGKVIARYLG